MFFLSLSLFPQAPPPERINYQGVLRDSSGNPLQGDFSMVFRFYDDKTGGTLLWEEIYDNGLHPPQISVSNGLFSVQLGDSTHRTAGSETNFRDVFSKYTDVYLSIQVDSDPEMTPRIKVLSSAYSQNANTLDGRNSDYFLDISSTTQTKLGTVIFNAIGDFYGIEGYGILAGGYFSNISSGESSRCYLGYYDGEKYEGIYAEGSWSGGYFKNNENSGYAYIALLDEGIAAGGNYAGGFFRDNDGSGSALVGIGDNGINAGGNNAGGFFGSLFSSGWAYIGYSSYKVYGSGGVSFVQNHPYEKDKVIVYSAPEGDEVATYTRGTGRLINGQAKIKLGETFKWVTNPDIGLTVYLTPVGEWADLYVEKKATDEIIVKSKDKNSNAVFDFIVYGLRIGFEETSIVQEKQMESYIPSFKDHRERYKKYPDLRNFNALERFKNMEAEVKGISKEEIELSRAIALKEAIHEYDPEKDPPVEKLFGYNLPEEPTNEIKGERIKEESNPNPPVLFEKEIKEENKREIIREEKIIKEEDDLSCFIVYNQVEEGDVVVMNIQNGSSLVLSNKEYDPMVVGVVSREKECRDGKIYVKTSGIAYVKVDANLKGIKKGDFIVTSSNLGYGMRGENPQQGTVIGKALEDLEGGLRKIKVLLMSR